MFATRSALLKVITKIGSKDTATSSIIPDRIITKQRTHKCVFCREEKSFQMSRSRRSIRSDQAGSCRGSGVVGHGQAHQTVSRSLADYPGRRGVARRHM